MFEQKKKSTATTKPPTAARQGPPAPRARTAPARTIDPLAPLITATDNREAARQVREMTRNPAYTYQLTRTMRELQTAGRYLTISVAYHELFGTEMQSDVYVAMGGKPTAVMQAPPLDRDPTELPVRGQRLTWDAFLNVVSLKLTYQDTLDEEGQELIDHFGYQSHNAIEGRFGLQMRSLIPTLRNRQPVLTFRGTEGGKMLNLEGQTDLLTDVDPNGIGHRPFTHNRELIETHVNHLTRHGKLILAGHSLGGAMAQWTASAWPEKTSRLVTFNAPGISKEAADRVEQHNRKNDGQLFSTHYHMAGDLVGHGGAAFTPGQIHTFRPTAQGDGNFLSDSYAVVKGGVTFQSHLTPLLTKSLQTQNRSDTQKALARPGEGPTNDINAILAYKDIAAQGQKLDPEFLYTRSTTTANNATGRVVTENGRAAIGRYIENPKAGEAVDHTLLVALLSGLSPGLLATLTTVDAIRDYLHGAYKRMHQRDELYVEIEKLVRKAKTREELEDIRRVIRKIVAAGPQSGAPDGLGNLHREWWSSGEEVRKELFEKIDTMWESWNPGSQE